MAYTLVMIKPDAVKRQQIGQILARFEEAGFSVRELALTRLSVADAQRFYAVHEGRPFYDELCAFMTSGPCVPCLIEGDDEVIPKVRALMGATDPAEAAPGTIRKDFAASKGENAIHGSDAPETARQEIAFWAAKLGWQVGSEVCSETSERS